MGTRFYEISYFEISREMVKLSYLILALDSVYLYISRVSGYKSLFA